MSVDSNKTKFNLGKSLAYSFTTTPGGTLVSAEIQDEVLNVFPEEEILTYGDVETLVDLLIAKDVEAWRVLPKKIRMFLMHTTEWQYRSNEKTGIINLVINDVEVRWNGSEWVMHAFHPDTK